LPTELLSKDGASLKALPSITSTVTLLQKRRVQGVF
jgi:hypothetical protein